MNKILIHKSLYVFDNMGENLSHEEMQYNYSKKTFSGRAKPIRIIGVPDVWSSTVIVHISHITKSHETALH